jgi:hypothetical protein
VIKAVLAVFVIVALFYAWKQDAETEFNDLENDKQVLIGGHHEK